ncbi:MAG: PspC domain-containing protein [Chitinophagaceae bacterium]|nr:PspC domain-containing protein [Chitinophagaceae bacterium]
MDKILQINYQGRTLSIEESAYQHFQDYENELKNYFMAQAEGEETFADLQYRMAEILDQKNAQGVIEQKDIDELISTIGRPKDLSDADAESDEKSENIADTKEKKKLFRNSKDKVIAGVCSGIANYFSIDPIAVRLIFFLFTVYNVATLFRFNLGVLAYIIFWAILQPKALEVNTKTKLFRNPKDQVLGGVCSGLAHFFNIETWIVRLIFLAPLLLGFITNNNPFKHFELYGVGSSFYSLTFISYIILWFITPLAKNNTDYMLLKGEPININTIQHSTSMETVTKKSKSGLSSFLKVVAYILLVLILIVMIPSLIGLTMAGIFSYQIADVVLFTSWMKTLALLGIVLFLALPVLGFIIWIFRKIAGYHKPNKFLRLTFGGLWAVGIASALLLSFNLISDHKTFVKQPFDAPLGIVGDTLYIGPSDSSYRYSKNVIFDFNDLNDLLIRQKDHHQIRAVQIKYRKTKNPDFSMRIERSAFGNNITSANQHAEMIEFNPQVIDNRLLIPSYLTLSNQFPYHFQHVTMTIFVPEHKTVIVSESLKRQMKHGFHSSDDQFYFHFEDEDDEPVQYDNHAENANTVPSTEIEEATQHLKEVKQEGLDKIKHAERELEDARKQAEREIKDAADELKNKLKDSI